MYPTAPVHPGNVRVYLPLGSPAENTAIHETWQKRMKDWLENANMNKALIKSLLSLLSQEHRNLYQNTLIGNPNGRFGKIFPIIFIEGMVFVTRLNSNRATKI